MAAKPDSEVEGLTRPVLVLAIRLLVLVALLVSIYLAWLAYQGGVPIGCGPDSDCDKVLGSKWSSLFGIPVSVFAVIVDLMVLLATLALKPKSPAVAQRRAWAVLVLGALLLIGASIWFVSIQVFVVQAICAYCMVAHGSGFLAGVLLLIAAPIKQMPERLWDFEHQVFVTTHRFKRAALLALLGLTALIVGQSSHEAVTGVITSIPGNPAGVTNTSVAATQATVVNAAITNATNANPATPETNAPAVVSATANSPVAAPPTPPASSVPAPRLFPVYNGQVQLNLDETPVIGSSTNQHVIVSLFDYTCHYCREMHPRLIEAQKAFRNDLVIVNLPTPLDPGCNPTMQRANPSHTNACDYARFSLAVWRADHSKHHDYDDWLFRGEKAPPILEARQYAAQLIGDGAFETALRDPWVEEQLKQGVGLYTLAYNMGQGRMPQLIVGPKVLVGTFTPEDLLGHIENNLGLKRNP
jgi:uncharacterized membrane protein/protein-disulfide isomerase